jgi:hypothetical protein
MVPTPHRAIIRNQWENSCEAYSPAGPYQMCDKWTVLKSLILFVRNVAGRVGGWKETDCILTMRKGEGMAKQRDKT